MSIARHLFAKDVTPEARARAEAHGKAAERLAGEIRGLSTTATPRSFSRAAVIGAGTMGGGIAMCLAGIGVPVILIDSSEDGLERGLKRVRDNYAATVARGRLTQADMDRRLSLIRGSLQLADIASSDLVIEAVFEDIGLKQEMFRQIDRLAPPGAVLATNTSGLDIDAIAAVTQRPEAVIGAHFFSPAHIMRLLEVVRADKTSDDVVARMMALGKQMGKVCVLARVYPGFIGNAMLRHYGREAHFLVEEGALPQDVDRALTNFGYAMGLFAVQDMAGTDVGYQTRKAQIATRPKDRRYSDLILTLVEQGRRGQKSGAGWYRYQAGSRTPLHDPAIQSLIEAESMRLGVKRRPIDDVEIIERCLYSMINEGARLLEKGIAQRASDIDVVYLSGYGFPLFRGGPMHLADQIGIGEVYDAVCRYHRQHGVWWEPAPLLAALARQGQTFEQWDASRVG